MATPEEQQCKKSDNVTGVATLEEQ